MNWEQIKGNFTEYKGKIKEQWGELTDDDLDRMAGQRDQLVGKIQQRYGCSREEAERQVETWTQRFH